MEKCEVCEEFSFGFLVKVETPYRQVFITVDVCNKCKERRITQEEIPNVKVLS